MPRAAFALDDGSFNGLKQPFPQPVGIIQRDIYTGILRKTEPCRGSALYILRQTGQKILFARARKVR